MFGRRKREEAAAADAAREAERHALFARLAERPEHICPFLGLEADRTGYVEGVSADHRCFAFGDPAPISAEQQTRVCQERGYGNCPRYLRGVLVIPTEELEALRRPRAAEALPPPPPPPAAEPQRRRRAPVLAILAVLLLVGGGGAAAFMMFGPNFDVSVNPTATPIPQPTAQPTPTLGPTPSADPSVTPSIHASPTPEPTPSAGDEFAFYEVSVSPGSYVLFALDGGAIGPQRTVAFEQFSFARAAAETGNDGAVYWVTQDGDLAGLGYRYPDSGDFRIRAVFLNEAGDRRSVFLEEAELDEVPEATPAP
ncbi:MAG: hypothetical protein M3153_10420 [Chloroflexota bacterium]|nr:hypothetical protein [Chloroflexota bacterium]